MQWIYHDGGREKAGFKKLIAGDCAVRAIAIATGIDYSVVYKELLEIQDPILDSKIKRTKNERQRKLYIKCKGTLDKGVFKWASQKYLLSKGWRWLPTMGIGTGCKTHLRQSELPQGMIICKISKHLVAVENGRIYDNHDPARFGTRCVYGIYIK